MSEYVRPHRNRRQHQQALARQQKRRRRRRLARIRRVRAWKTIRSLRFWTRVSFALICLLCVVFWARFAYVYDIPTYADRGLLTGITSYVAVKPWWFGPPLFDLGAYTPEAGSGGSANQYSVLLESLGKYADVVASPHIVWVSKP